VVSEQSTLHLFFFVHVPDKIWVQEVGTRTIEPLQYRSHQDQQKTMGDENKEDGAIDPFKIFLEESLA
jgi:hypothetical protein